ncbi:MAG TPA: hypothetical protein PLC52_09435 [Anaerolineales bacterium]|nr:hypothetical protein [Anaerolineales bacterium]HRQ93072.1 hypothetical protein [Anaerolineales bacterium]
MLQFLYDFTQSPFFPILLFIWVAIDVIWVQRWRGLFERLGKLITKPWIFAKDPEPKVPPLYPREMLEQLALVSSSRERKAEEARSSKVGAEQKDGKRTKAGSSFLNAMQERIFNSEHPFRTVGYVIFLVGFVFFLIADAISVAQTLRVMGLITESLTGLFERFDFAVLGGALLSAIVGVWVYMEALGNSHIIDLDILNEAQRRFLRGISLFVSVNSVIVMIAFAINRLIAIGILAPDPTLEIILSAILYGLVPINSALAAAICFPWASNGVLVLLFIAAFIIIGILPVIAFLADVVWRVVYVVLDIAIWALFTPLMLVPHLIGKIRV